MRTGKPLGVSLIAHPRPLRQGCKPRTTHRLCSIYNHNVSLDRVHTGLLGDRAPWKCGETTDQKQPTQGGNKDGIIKYSRPGCILQRNIIYRHEKASRSVVEINHRKYSQYLRNIPTSHRTVSGGTVRPDFRCKTYTLTCWLRNNTPQTSDDGD